MQGSNSEMHERFARKEKNTGGKQVHKAEKIVVISAANATTPD